MMAREPFQPQDLAELQERLLGRAAAVVTMQEVYDGDRAADVIGMRHDVDNFIEPAVKFAQWEAEQGHASTYFVLHSAPYWDDKPLLVDSLERIAEHGHEIGIHNNALTVALQTGRDPVDVLAEAIEELRGYGHTIRGTVAHGDRLCYDHEGRVRYVNDEMLLECPRPEIGERWRTIGQLEIRPVPLSMFGLDYDANWLPRSKYLSDSGGRWSQPFDDLAAGFPFDGQLHALVHPDWWGQAFQAKVTLQIDGRSVAKRAAQ